ncbi:ferredoxin [Rhodococcoides fascians A21d2]|uniref:ferredoxin n=1 Tax=Rhodococcoides fascians TaxID=1828 RepID=UPI00055B2301|nr:ferredoxin [Rhodococcus fascians]QII00273.1 ferredoxin [Rhodococcus fascians A21d2]
MKLTVVEKKCAGHALCTIIAPELFEMNAQGKATVLGDVTDEVLDLAEESVTECPAAAILLSRGDNNE